MSLDTLRDFAKAHFPRPVQRVLRWGVRGYFSLRAKVPGTRGQLRVMSNPKVLGAGVRRRLGRVLHRLTDNAASVRWHDVMQEVQRLRVRGELAKADELLAAKVVVPSLPDELRLAWSEIKLALGDPRGAADILFPSVGAVPTDILVTCRYIRLALRAGQAARARDVAKAFIRTNKASFQNLCELGHLFREEGQFLESVAIFKQIRLHAAYNPAWAAHWPGFVAAANEYAGYSAEAEYWTAAYERQREAQCRDHFGPEHRERPVFLGRLAGSLGDLCSRFDGLLKLRALGMLAQQPSTWYLPSQTKPANEALVALIGEHFEICRDDDAYQRHVQDTPWYYWRDFEKIELTDGRIVHNTLACALSEEQWQAEGREPLFKLPEEMIEAGWKKLAAFGVERGDWFVAIHVREPGFYDEGKTGFNNSSLHRCADVESFAPAIRWIIDSGGWVIRLGDDSMAPPPLDHPRFIDYALADWKEDWLDLFFVGESRYFLGTNSGPMCLAAALGVVSGITNYVPIGMPPLSPRNLFIPKLLHADAENCYLTFLEMVGAPFRMANRFHLFDLFDEQLGVRLVDNTPDEILDFTKDLHAFASQGAREVFSYSAKVGQSFTLQDCHYVAQIAPSFVRRHPECLGPAPVTDFAARWDRLGEGWIQLSAEELSCYEDRFSAAGRWQEGLAVPQAAEFLGVADVTIRQALGTCLRHVGRCREAVAVLESVVGEVPESIPSRRELIAAFRGAGREEEAVQEYRSLLERWPRALPEWLEFGHMLREMGRYDEAITVYMKPQVMVDQKLAVSAELEGILAAACEYAGDHAGARRWVDAYEKWRDEELVSILRSNPLIISLGELGSRIGDIAARFDLLFKGRALGMIDLPSERFLIDTTRYYVNSPYVELWRDILPFSSPSMAEEIKAAPWSQKRDLADIRMHDGPTLHYPVAYSLIEDAWLRDGRGPAVRLALEKVENGWRRLEEVGIKRGDWFVALHVREGGFFDESEIGPNSAHLHRSASIENYQRAIDFIISQGGWVVRIGDPSMTPIEPRQGLFDYALSDMRCPEMDVFLMSQCRYLLGTNSGPMGVCTSFGVVCGITNYIPIAFPLCSPRNLMLPKMIWSRREGRYLTIDEMMSPPLGFANRYHIYKRFADRFEALLYENSAEEILAFTQDLHDWAGSEFASDDPRHDRLRDIFAARDAHYISPMAKSWLDRYEPEGCLGDAPNRNFEAYWLADTLPGDVAPATGKSSAEASGRAEDPALKSIFDDIAAYLDLVPDIRPSFQRELAAARDGPTAKTLAALADALEAGGQFALALACTREAARLVPGERDLLQALADRARLMGRLSEALSALQSLSACDPDNSNLYRAVGEVALKKGDYEAALEVYGKLSNADPVSGGHGMGLAARGLGRLQESIGHFERILEAAPDSFSTLEQFTETAKLANESELALGGLTRMRELRPDDKSLWFDHFDYLVELGHKEVARTELAALAEWIASDSVGSRTYGGRFQTALRCLGVFPGQEPWAQAMAAIKAEAGSSDKPKPMESAHDTGEALGLDSERSYIELLKRALTNTTNTEADARLYRIAKAASERGIPDLAAVKRLMTGDPGMNALFARAREAGTWAFNDSPEYVTTTTKTMIGLARLQNIEDSVRTVMEENIAGDLVECGVWRGGAGVLMRGMLHVLGDRERRVWLCDSFKGLPSVEHEYERTLFGEDLEWVSVDVDTVKRTFAEFGLLDERTHFIEGWFDETLPTAPIRRIALLRLDGDYYTSTMDALVALYDRVSPGGFIIIDDYYSVGTCSEAVHAYLDARGIAAPSMERVDQHAVVWRKQG